MNTSLIFLGCWESKRLRTTGLEYSLFTIHNTMHNTMQSIKTETLPCWLCWTVKLYIPFNVFPEFDCSKVKKQQQNTHVLLYADPPCCLQTHTHTHTHTHTRTHTEVCADPASLSLISCHKYITTDIHTLWQANYIMLIPSPINTVVWRPWLLCSSFIYNFICMRLCCRTNIWIVDFTTINKHQQNLWTV